jgi:multiple sugar transport system substrate-binding protein
MNRHSEREDQMSRLTAKALVATALVPLLAGPLAAQDYGNFDGYTLRVKLIGGAQYEPLYATIAEWEAATGATVEILSRKNHFELDREIKQDIAAGTLDWCVGSNHTSFAPQYGNIYADLNDLIDADTLAGFVPLVLEHSTVDGRLVQLPRHSDVSNLYYIKSLYEDADNRPPLSRPRYGYDLAPPETWAQVADQAKFFANPPDFYGTQYRRQGRGDHRPLLRDAGGRGWPAFHRRVGAGLQLGSRGSGAQLVRRSLQLERRAAGVPNYLWDDTGLGFASGTVAINLDWGGWSAFFNDPENSKVAGDVGLIRAPQGSSGLRTGWSGSHSFSITETCDNKEAAASFVTFLTDHDRQMIEARMGILPTRTQVWDDAKAEFEAEGKTFMVEVFETYATSMAEDAFTPPLIPEWIEVSNALWPRLQAAIVGDMTAQEALDEAAEEAREIMEDAGYR